METLKERASEAYALVLVAIIFVLMMVICLGWFILLLAFYVFVIVLLLSPIWGLGLLLYFLIV